MTKFFTKTDIKNGPRKIIGRQPLKNPRKVVCLNITSRFKFFKGSLPQIFLAPFLNTLSHLIYPSSEVNATNVKVSFLLRKILLGNLNEAISLVETDVIKTEVFSNYFSLLQQIL